MQSIQRGILPAMAAFVLMTAAGCAPERIYFNDTIDIAFDWNPVLDNQEAMHQPYVQGSYFGIGVHSRFKDEDMTNWTVEVQDPDILEITNVEVFEHDEPNIPETMWMDAHALAEGTTVLELYGKRGQFITSTPIEVAVPDNARLRPHGPLIIHQPELIVDEHEFQVLEGGLSTYLVEFYRGDTRLYGNATHDVIADGEIEVHPRSTFLFEDRDWLQVESWDPGTHEVTLFSGDVEVETFEFDVLEEDEIGHVALHAEETVIPEEEYTYTILAESYDFGGRPVYGVEFAWNLDGFEEEGLGDLYRYEFDPDEDNLLEAFFGQHTDSVRIHGEGYVDSSNNIGCSVDNDGTGAGATAAAVALLGLLGLLRLRRS